MDTEISAELSSSATSPEVTGFITMAAGGLTQLAIHDASWLPPAPRSWSLHHPMTAALGRGGLTVILASACPAATFSSQLL